MDGGSRSATGGGGRGRRMLGIACRLVRELSKTAPCIAIKLLMALSSYSKSPHSYGRNSCHDASVSWDVKSIR
jgi:hypothetical protein